MRRFRRLAYGVALLALVACGLVIVLPAAGTPGRARYYLALGDSLSTGYQPRPYGIAGNTRAGYVNDLYSYERSRVSDLELVDVGCPGDTTTSLLTGVGNKVLARRSHCDRAGGSQLRAAVAFLKSHDRPGEVPLITLDIGINDINRCGEVIPPGHCLLAGERAVAINTTRILSALAGAAPSGTRLVEMNLYDTHLGESWKTPGIVASAGQLAFLNATRRVNATILRADRDAGFRTAEVAAAFDTGAANLVTWHGVRVPADLARACALTWACSPLPIGHNIHPNDAGYRVIARTFEQVIGRLPSPRP